MIALPLRIIILLSVLSCSLPCIAQSLSSLAPMSATPGQTVDVAIRGVNTHFRAGVSGVEFGSGITVQKFTVQNELTGIATISVSPSATVGFRDVSVITGSETVTLVSGFEVFNAVGVFRVNIQVLPVETISLSDFDLSNSTTQPILFFTNVYNNNINRRVEISVLISTASRGYIGRMYLTDRQLAPNSYTRLSNRDFNRYETNGVTGQQFITDVRAAGTFPPDDYTYKLQVKENGNLLEEDVNTWTVENQLSNPELIMPGTLFSDEAQAVLIPLPLFQWFGQSSRYDFALYKYRHGQTPEEVVRSLPVFKQEDIAGTSFLYPNYAEKLIEGQLYAWQVRGKVTSSNGVRYLPSEVFRFVYSAAASLSNNYPAVAKISISPQEIELSAGQQIQFTATVLDKDGNPVTTVSPVWQLTPAKGSISPGGLYTAARVTSPTTLAILVKAGAASDFATVTIKPKIGPAADGSDWLIDEMLRKIFGLPPAGN